MTNSERIILNTSIQYLRTLLNVVLSFISTRLVLQALGQDDYGIFSVVAGIISMISFVKSALITSTQRFMSYTQGKGDIEKLKSIFANSIMLHAIIAIFLFIIIIAIEPYAIHRLLKIDSERLSAARDVYFCVAGIISLTFITAPIKSLFISREEIVYVSIVDIMDGVIRLLLAVWLLHITYDRLIVYGLFQLSIAVFNLVILSIIASYKFEECHFPRLSEFDAMYAKELTSFSGWMIYTTGCLVLRVQGVAVLINRFMGTAVNAAFGIAQQISGAIQFLAQSLVNAMAPQIMKAEGRGERQKMLMLAEALSKYAFLILALIIIPLVFEMPTVLKIWLKDVPPYAVLLCRYILITSLCDQITRGLMAANNAVGKLKTYSLVINTTKMLTLPAIWICMKWGVSFEIAMLCYIGIELFCALLRLPFLKHNANLSIRHFIQNVFAKIAIPFLTIILASYAIVYFFDSEFRFIFTIIVGVSAGLVSIWFFALSANEKRTILDIFKNKFPYKK